MINLQEKVNALTVSQQQMFFALVREVLVWRGWQKIWTPPGSENVENLADFLAKCGIEMPEYT